MLPINNTKPINPFASLPNTITDNMAFMGGTIRLLTGVTLTSGTQLIIKHQLGRIPKCMLILNAVGNYTPGWMHTAPWTYTTISVSFNETLAPSNILTLLIF